MSLDVMVTYYNMLLTESKEFGIMYVLEVLWIKSLVY